MKKNKKPSKADTIRAAVFEALWKDPKYVRLQARKDMLGRAWNMADSRREPEAARLGKLFDSATRRIQKYEDEQIRRAQEKAARS